MSTLCDLSGWGQVALWLWAGVVLAWFVARELHIRALRRLNQALRDGIDLSDNLADAYKAEAKYYQREAEYWREGS